MDKKAEKTAATTTPETKQDERAEKLLKLQSNLKAGAPPGGAGCSTPWPK